MFYGICFYYDEGFLMSKQTINVIFAFIFGLFGYMLNLYIISEMRTAREYSFVNDLLLTIGSLLWAIFAYGSFGYKFMDICTWTFNKIIDLQISIFSQIVGFIIYIALLFTLFYAIVKGLIGLLFFVVIIMVMFGIYGKSQD